MNELVCTILGCTIIILRYDCLFYSVKHFGQLSCIYTVLYE